MLPTTRKNTPKAPTPHDCAEDRRESDVEKSGITPAQREHDEDTTGQPLSDRQEMERSYAKQKP
jgi:hypothetical protein